MRIRLRNQGFRVTVFALSFLFGHSGSGQTFSLTQTGSIPSDANLIEVAGPYAYLAAGPALKIFDIHNPSTPTALGTFKFDIEQIYGIAAAGPLLYVAADFEGLAVLDVSNPIQPALRSKIKTGRQTVAVAAANGRVLAADTKNGVEVIDVSNADNPLKIGDYYMDGYCRHVAISGSFGYAVGTPAGFSILDISKHDSPKELSLQPLERATMFAIGELNGANKVAAITDRFGLQLYDISDPAAPVRISEYKRVGPSRRIKFAGPLVYVADGGEGVQLIDVSNPGKPMSAGSYKTPFPAVDVATQDRLVFVAMGSGPAAQAAGTSNLPAKPGVLILRLTAQ
jgi:hypothetical protein